MRKWIGGVLLAALFSVTAQAQIVPALPFNLQNGTLADASQVMANFNQILNNVNTNAAHNGANSDITSLVGLTTPLAPSVGGTSVYSSTVTATGTANAIVVTTVSPSNYALSAGKSVIFVPTANNTDDTTINVSGTGAIHIYRRTQLGLKTLVGGELLAGDVVTLIYDGTNYQLQGRFDMVGQVMDTVQASIPLGWAQADGTCNSQTATKYAALYSLAGTTWGSCSAGLFALPNLQNKSTVGAGTSGGASVACGTGTLSVTCGSTTTTIATANVPPVNFSLNWVQDTGGLASGQAVSSFSTSTAQFNSGINVVTGITLVSPSVTVSGHITGSIGQGSPTAFSVQNPVTAVVKAVKL